jgi:hypothetical protein
LRFAALGLAALGTLITPVDLLLVNHVQKPTQWIPFVLLGINAAVIAWVLLRPSSRALRLFQAVSWLMMLGGLAGVGFHLAGNLEIARESAPDARGLALLLETVRGGNPVLAPGLFAQVALLGLMFTHAHPLLHPRASAEPVRADTAAAQGGTDASAA